MYDGTPSQFVVTTRISTTTGDRRGAMTSTSVVSPATSGCPNSLPTSSAADRPSLTGLAIGEVEALLLSAKGLRP